MPRAVPTHSPAAGEVVLFLGTSCAISAAGGDITPGGRQGLFVRDVRTVSRWELAIDGAPVPPLVGFTAEAWSVVFVGRAGSGLLVERHRVVGDGLREDLVLHNPGAVPVACRLTLIADADFADLFDVRAGRRRRRASRRLAVVGDRLEAHYRWADVVRSVQVTAGGDPRVSVGPTGGRFHWRVTVPPRGRWTTTLHARPLVAGRRLASTVPARGPAAAGSAVRAAVDWRAGLPAFRTADPRWQAALAASASDLAGLRMPARGGIGPTVAAGAPWYLALFGRDSLLAAWMALPVAPDLALGTLRALARLQGRRIDPVSEEQPGRIPHELRHGAAGVSTGGTRCYYGTADASPLFVMLLAEAYDWGADPAAVRALLPAADRALQWMAEFGDVDGDGFVEYRSGAPRGLVNQGWKDSADSVSWPAGPLARGPIALVEVQAYGYAALRARARLAAAFGDPATDRRLTAAADALRTAFDAAFWLPAAGCYALALDGDKRPVDAVTSNAGHALWAGIALPQRAGALAERLLAADLFSGWGLRTMATGMRRYDPLSYHNGSVWPHDTAIVAAGLARYGQLAAAGRLAEALLDAAALSDGRLPEVFAGFGRAALPVPVPYPSSCVPQAWAAAAPWLLLRALLRLDAAVPDGTAWCAPAADLPDLAADGLPLGGGRFALVAGAGRGRLDLPPGLHQGDGARPLA